MIKKNTSVGNNGIFPDRVLQKSDNWSYFGDNFWAMVIVNVLLELGESVRESLGRSTDSGVGILLYFAVSSIAGM